MAKAIYGAGTDLADAWAKARQADSDAGRLRALVRALRTQAQTTPEARKCIHYVFGNRHRMRYPQFRARGLRVSSGVVEAGCKQIGARLKRAGMRWTVAGANAILALRCCILSGRFEDFWDDEPQTPPDAHLTMMSRTGRTDALPPLRRLVPACYALAPSRCYWHPARDRASVRSGSPAAVTGFGLAPAGTACYACAFLTLE